MILYIDTTKNNLIHLRLKGKNGFLSEKKIKVNYNQAQKLLPLIKIILLENNLNVKDITKIVVNSVADKFTSLRIGVLTANALAYALKIPVENFNGKFLKCDNFNLVEADYLSEPNISVGKKAL